MAYISNAARRADGIMFSASVTTDRQAFLDLVAEAQQKDWAALEEWGKETIPSERAVPARARNIWTGTLGAVS